MAEKKTYVASGQTPPWPSYETTQKSRTYNAVKASGDSGISREAICTQTGLPKQRVWFYLSELRRAGLIKRLGDAIDPASLSAGDSLVYAMNALENAFAANATEHVQGCKACKSARKEEDRCTTFKEMNRQLVRYSKIKSLALGAKTVGEERAAMRQALVDLVKMVL